MKGLVENYGPGTITRDFISRRVASHPQVR